MNTVLTDSDVKIEREVLTPVLLSEIMPLAESNRGETGLHHNGLSVDDGLYLELERNGALRVYTVRIAGVLVGYSVMFVREHPHYKPNLQATQDALYVDAHHRGRLGVKLMRYVDEHLSHEGVGTVYRQSNVRRNIGSLLERMGYQPVETVYMRRLVNGT